MTTEAEEKLLSFDNGNILNVPTPPIDWYAEVIKDEENNNNNNNMNKSSITPPEKAERTSDDKVYRTQHGRNKCDTATQLYQGQIEYVSFFTLLYIYCNNYYCY
jgi:hypothetical protein